MRHQTGSFTSSDGLNIHTESWLPDSDPHAVVLISHGIGEHIGRYAHVAARLVADRYAVYGLDHRGHGKSDGLRSYFDDLNEPVNDLKQYLDQIKVAQPSKKIFLYGHSLGSLIALLFTLRYQSEITGLISSSTPLEVEPSQPKFLIAAAGVLNNIIPKAAITPLPTVYISTDPAEVKAYETDPLIYHGNVRVRVGYQIVQYSRIVKARLSEIKLPLLVFHGSADKICPPAGSETLYRGAGSSDKTLKIYPGMYHETHNEVEKSTVLNDIAAWLGAH
ncbi:MAG: lysophospholipase [Chloroflexota bacterium]